MNKLLQRKNISYFVLSLIMLLAFACMSLAADITISSSVDRTDVEFGDTIELTVSIRRPMENKPISRSFGNGGFSFSFNSSSFSSMGMDDDFDFNIDNIPNFDIAGRRQSSQSRMVNGVGESVKQIILTLVPQKEGSLVIPAFSMKDKEGKEHSSTPITINVRKAAEDPEEEDLSSTNTSNENSNDNGIKDPEAKKENNLFNFILTIVIVLTVALVAIIAFATYIGSKPKKNNDIEDAVIVKEEPQNPVESVKKQGVEKIDFASKYASLKKEYKEVSNEFYRKNFDLFKKACCYTNSTLSEDMTFDELLKKCNELAGTNNIKQATGRLAEDIEMVMYANAMPNRQLSKIESDIKEVLNSL